MLGATGSGKSFLLNFLVTHAQKYEPATVIFDLGHSYRKLATLLGGSFLELGLRERNVTINPVRAAADAGEPALSACVYAGAARRRRTRTACPTRKTVSCTKAIENLYVLDARPAPAVHPREPAAAGAVGPADQVGRRRPLRRRSSTTSRTRSPSSGSRSSTSRRCAPIPALLEPLLFYVLHRVNAAVTDTSDAGRLKLCVMDEAWRFIQHDRLRAYVEEALKTWRKRNGAMILATQTIDDFASADLLRTVVESCPTKLLLANPSLDRAPLSRAVSAERRGAGSARAI